MFRRLVCAALVASAVSAPAATPDSAAPPADCMERNPSGGDIRVITCTLPGGRPHRLTARLGGGHDDTAATLTATLDGLPTGCDPGSKTSLFGEDGDVSLHCRVAASAGTAHTLVVTVVFSHAWYRDFAFAPE